MQQTSFSLVIAAESETLWTILGDMVRNPDRYEDKVSRKKLTEEANGTFTRTMERAGHVESETIEFHLDALMVEITSETSGLTLIHQIVPSGEVSLLNLAANWTGSSKSAGCDEETLDLPQLTQETTQQRLALLGTRIKEVAEAI